MKRGVLLTIFFIILLAQTNGQEIEFKSSNLPIILIDTDGNEIVDEPKINGRIQIIYDESGDRNSLESQKFYHESKIGIELRGNSTQRRPKKPYLFETRQEDGENLNVSLFHMPKENDWILRASYFDHTFIRNPLSMAMSRMMGHWASRTQFVELVLNGKYQGIYILMETLKRDKNRVDISKLNADDVVTPEVTGGYIFEITGFESNLGQSRNLKYPDYADATPEQIEYITNYDNQFRAVMQEAYFSDTLKGYHKYIDVPSFIDELIIQEAMRNSDAYGWSGYFHKDREGKLKAGPAWDFDQSGGNSSYPDNGIITGWMFAHNQTINTPFFWKALYSDPWFRYRIRLRWESLREDLFKTENLFLIIDSLANELNEAAKREFSTWDVLGKDIWRESAGYEQRDTYSKEVEYLKSFLYQRWQWMDEQLSKIQRPDMTTSTDEPQLHEELMIFPNPASNNFVIYNKAKENLLKEIIVFNINGEIIFHKRHMELDPIVRYRINISGWPEGIYAIRITDQKDQYHLKKLIIQK